MSPSIAWYKNEAFFPFFQPRCHEIIKGLEKLQDQVKEVLKQDKKILGIAEKLHKVTLMSNWSMQSGDLIYI